MYNRYLASLLLETAVIHCGHANGRCVFLHVFYGDAHPPSPRSVRLRPLYIGMQKTCMCTKHATCGVAEPGQPFLQRALVHHCHRVPYQVYLLEVGLPVDDQVGGIADCLPGEENVKSNMGLFRRTSPVLDELARLLLGFRQLLQQASFLFCLLAKGLFRSLEVPLALFGIPLQRIHLLLRCEDGERVHLEVLEVGHRIAGEDFPQDGTAVPPSEASAAAPHEYVPSPPPPTFVASVRTPSAEAPVSRTQCHSCGPLPSRPCS